MSAREGRGAASPGKGCPAQQVPSLKSLSLGVECNVRLAIFDCPTRSAMKLLFDFFPIVLFFVTYKFGSAWVPEEHAWLKDNPIYLATLVAIAATVVQVGHAWIRQRKVENMHWWSLALIVGFGGATSI